MGARLGEHGLSGRDLHAFPALGLTESLLRSLLEPVIALPVRELDALGLEQLDDRGLLRVHGFGERPVGLIVEDVPDRLEGIAFRVTDEPDGSALDPSGRVYAGDDLLGLVEGQLRQLPTRTRRRVRSSKFR